jgi:hypothetical protein
MTQSIDSTGKEIPVQKVRRSAAEIQALLMEYEKSGMSAKSFCRAHQLKRAYFSRWLLRYGSKKATKGFVAIDLPVETAASGKQTGLFAEYRGIKFYQKVDASYLKSLLS